ncbi:DNA-binding transcriptional regulator, GntR family [Marinobacter segnicrescens]|uniref:DNA-binding transcriptional regulator, GntR family n=1 Tax=Marinobacter segnicrescens TaxID=430453 RepID=A0A1H9YTX9_9GAMM|nr:MULTISPECIES: GntR family transcriptional regulator [Marinobacter]UZD64413.1 GntR family transcriptional regulator [Marinobacter sp. AN1]SES72628.1 DNA-binding transcriptional regulator, GntR family [Marinobacter segnicrescens]
MTPSDSAFVFPDNATEDVHTGRRSRLSAQQRAVQQIRDLIVSGELAPGIRLQEQALSDYLGLSRTPVREAFRVLAAEGLVVIRTNRGAEVRRMELAELMDTFEVIATLDGHAGLLAATRATEADIAAIAELHRQMIGCYQQGERLNYFKCNQAIHQKIIEASGNPVLVRQLEGLNALVQPYRYNVNALPESWRRSVEDHERILDALQRRDGPALQAVLCRHLPDKFSVLKQLEAMASS